MVRYYEATTEFLFVWKVVQRGSCYIEASYYIQKSQNIQTYKVIL